MITPRRPADVLKRAGVLAVLGASFTGADAMAAVQEPDRPGGWLGVRVRQNYECAWVSSDQPADCDVVIDITEVQDGGPAQIGGLLPGDRMIAINGQDLTFQTWDPLRESIRAGTPVSIDVNRDSIRYFVRVTPAVFSVGMDSGRWVGTNRPRARSAGSDRRVFVVTLTELDRTEGGGAFVLTVRDTDRAVAIEPAALRVLNGQLQLVPISEEIPNLRREIVGTLRGITDSSYERAASAGQVIDQIRARLPSDQELRERLSRIAQVGLEEMRLATTFRGSWAGAQFMPARRNLASAVEAERQGLLVVRVIDNTPAAQLGLREGDIVFAANDTPIREVKELAWVVDNADGPVEIRWSRKGSLMSGTYERR